MYQIPFSLEQLEPVPCNLKFEAKLFFIDFYLLKGCSLRRGIGRKSSSSRDFSPRVSEVMSLSDTKLQCLLCYKKFSTKEESAAHMAARHRITLAGAIDKSMRSVYT